MLVVYYVIAALVIMGFGYCCVLCNYGQLFTLTFLSPYKNYKEPYKQHKQFHKIHIYTRKSFTTYTTYFDLTNNYKEPRSKYQKPLIHQKTTLLSIFNK